MKTLKTLEIVGLFLLLIFCSNLHAARKVATVAIVRGKATLLRPGMSNAKTVKRGDFIVNDSSLLTGDESFVRLKFVDGSYLNLGANSKIVVNEITRKKEGLVSLLKGKVRSKISKATIKNKSAKVVNKFLIKTRNASVGVRGTDFMTIHNHDSKVTSLVVFGGKVAMARIEDNMLLPKISKRLLGSMEKEDLHAVLKSPTTKVVTKGRYSGVVPAYDNATVAVKISPKQLDILERNEQLDFSKKTVAKLAAEKTKPKPKPKKEKEIKKIAEPELVEGPPPEGYFDNKTGDFAPKAGGFLDINTGIYVQPPPDSKLDKKEKVFVVSKAFGDVDEKTGDYVPPKGLELDAKKGFVLAKLDRDQEMDIAAELFDVDKKKITKKMREKLRDSLQRVLVAKKAILNQDVKEDILDTPLDDDEYIFEIEREFDRAQKGLREVLDVNLAFALGYNSNVTEDFLGETIKVTDTSANYSNLALKIGYNNYLTSRWLVMPVVDAAMMYYLSPDNKQVSDARQIHAAIAVDNLYNHGVGKMPAALLFGLKVHRSNKLNNDHNTYSAPYVNDNVERHDEDSLYQRYLALSVGERLYLTDYDEITLKFSLINFDGFSSILNGKVLKYDFEFKKKIRPRYELTLGVGYDDRSTKISSGKTTHRRGWLQFDTHGIADVCTLLFGVKLNETDYLDSERKEQNGAEMKVSSHVGLERVLTDNLTGSVIYNYNSMDSKDEGRRFNQHDVRIKLNYKF